MTDKFVPTEPGLYWFRYEDSDNIAQACSVSGILRAYSRLAVGWSHVHELDWIAPVTPPDVVREMRAVLKKAHEHMHQLTAIIPGNDMAYKINTDLMAEIRAVLAKLGGA